MSGLQWRPFAIHANNWLQTDIVSISLLIINAIKAGRVIVIDDGNKSVDNEYSNAKIWFKTANAMI